jgi:hypothetical protein
MITVSFIGDWPYQLVSSPQKYRDNRKSWC